MFHVTASSNRSSILAYGLDATRFASPWQNKRETAERDPMMLKDQPIGNYFNWHPDDAWRQQFVEIYEEKDVDFWLMSNPLLIDNWIFDPETAVRADFLMMTSYSFARYKAETKGTEMPTLSKACLPQCSTGCCGHSRLASAWYTTTPIKPQWLMRLDMQDMEHLRQTKERKLCERLCRTSPSWQYFLEQLIPEDIRRQANTRWVDELNHTTVQYT